MRWTCVRKQTASMNIRAPKSVTGMLLAALYVIMSALVFIEFLTCKGIACGVVIVLALGPAGYGFWWLYRWMDKIYVFGLSEDASIGLILGPSVLINGLALYFLGKWAGIAARRIFASGKN